MKSVNGSERSKDGELEQRSRDRTRDRKVVKCVNVWTSTEQRRGWWSVQTNVGQNVV